MTWYFYKQTHICFTTIRLLLVGGCPLCTVYYFKIVLSFIFIGLSNHNYYYKPIASMLSAMFYPIQVVLWS